MTDDFDFVAQRFESLLDPSWVVWEKTWLVVNQNIDLYSFSYSVFDEIKKRDIFWWPFEEKLRRNHPSCHVNGAFGFFDGGSKGIKILFAIDIKFGVDEFSGRGKAVEPVDVEVRWFDGFPFEEVQEHDIILDVLGLKDKSSMVGDENDTEVESSLGFTKEVFKAMTERKIFLNLSKLVFVGDSVILDADLTFFPLGPQIAHGAAALLVSSAVFFDHEEFAVDISFKGVVVFDEIGEHLVVKDVIFLSQIVEVVD